MLECLYLASLSNLVYCFCARPGAYLRVDHLTDFQKCRLLLNQQILESVGWKGLPGTNTLAYYEYSSITAVKSVITWGH